MRRVDQKKHLKMQIAKKVAVVDLKSPDLDKVSLNSPRLEEAMLLKRKFKLPKSSSWATHKWEKRA